MTSRTAARRRVVAASSRARLRAASFAAALALLAAPGLADDAADAVQFCLDCHADPDLTMSFDDGTEMSLAVDPADIDASVHAGNLVCTDCHGGYDSGDHPSGRTFANQRAYAQASYEVCKSCHFETYTRALEGVHFEQMSKGNPDAPVCADCHGPHRIEDPHAKASAIAKGCANCHAPMVEAYRTSVHGKALLDEGNPDVPGCADCHTSHAIADADSVRFRLNSPEICIGCHGDEQKMARYGIPTDVATSYLSDFHGVTASLSKGMEVDERHLVVTCGDCHGVHDVQALESIPAGAMKERVAQVCSDCHQGAAADFPAAWLSHYRPTLSNAPLVFLIDLAYKIFIPFMILGLGLQVLLHLYRVAIRR